MKNIAKSIFVLLGVIAVSCSTDDVQDRPVIEGVAAPVLSAPQDGATYTLALENASQQAERFVWSAADYNGAVAINYTLEMDLAGGDFSEPQVLGGTSGELHIAVSVADLNIAAIALGAVPEEAINFDVRVVSDASGFSPMISNVITITVTPYNAEIPTPELYVVGQIQSYYGLNGWDNGTAIPMRYIGDGTTKVFEAYIKVGASDGFKFIGEQGTWDNGNYGVIGGVQDGNLENSGGSGDVKLAEIEGDGLYYIRVNIDALTYTYVKMNWGVIGNATPNGWDSETAMNYDFDSNQFQLTTALNDGEMKFRSSNTGNAFGSGDWGFNVGNSDPYTAYDQNAPNFVISSGNYELGLEIHFDGTATVSGL